MPGLLLLTGKAGLVYTLIEGLPVSLACNIYDTNANYTIFKININEIEFINTHKIIRFNA